jgi:hypothetical protein
MCSSSPGHASDAIFHNGIRQQHQPLLLLLLLSGRLRGRLHHCHKLIE